jgi:hypothetical protein
VSALSEADRTLVAEAAGYLERPGFLLKAADIVGKPAESLVKRLPGKVQGKVADATRTALDKALAVAIQSLDVTPAKSSADTDVHSAKAATFELGQWHSAAAAAAGFAGGFFGLAGMPVELPVTTTVMLRSIAAIAREYGEDLSDPAVRLECLSVLALGGKMASPVDGTFEDGAQPTENMESAYWSARLGLAMALRSAARYASQRSAADIARAMADGTAPLLVKLVTMVAARFQVVVSEKAVAQALPIVGAAAGAALNAAFADHFNRVARAHFGLRRLEREHGADAVRRAYAHALEALP